MYLRAPVEMAAKLSVKETEQGPSRFVLYRTPEDIKASFASGLAIDRTHSAADAFNQVPAI